MSLEADLLALLKRLKLGQTIPTLPDRLALARAQKLDYAAFLTLILADEVQRRDNLALERRLTQAGFEEVFRRYLAPDLLVIDDFGLHRLNQQQSEDVYALIIERHRRSSFIVTSNRDVSEWVGLFADPILANSALDRLANGAHQLVIEGPSYRAKLAPRAPTEAPMT